MADWALPVLTSLYTEVLDMLKARDQDSVSLFGVPGTLTNIPENAIHFQRDTNIFHERIAGSWQPRPIGIGGGGTGSSDPSSARTNLGIGTMGTQNANNVAITGGTISGIAAFDVAGSMVIGGNVNAAGFFGNGYYLNPINAAYVAGVLPDTTLPDPLPARNAGWLTNLQASQLSSTLGYAPPAALGSGPASAATFLRGDGTWAVPSSSGVPAGAVILMTIPCPPGFTRVPHWDGYYARFGPAHTAGGALSHAHGPGSYVAPAHTHGAGSLSASSHNHGGSTGSISISISGSTGSGGSHTHTFSDSFSGTTGGESNGQMNVDAGNSGNMTRSQHTHDYSGSISGTTSNDGSHSHSFSGSGSGSGSISSSAPGVSGVTAYDGGGAITGGSDWQLNNPPYIDFYACLKD